MIRIVSRNSSALILIQPFKPNLICDTIFLCFKYLQQFLVIFVLWSEMKDFARLSKIGLSNIWKETRKEEISFHGWMLTAFAGLFYAKMYAFVRECVPSMCKSKCVYVWLNKITRSVLYALTFCECFCISFFTFTVDIRTYYLYSLLHHSMSDFRSKSKRRKEPKMQYGWMIILPELPKLKKNVMV